MAVNFLCDIVCSDIYTSEHMMYKSYFKTLVINSSKRILNHLPPVHGTREQTFQYED